MNFALLGLVAVISGTELERPGPPDFGPRNAVKPTRTAPSQSVLVTYHHTPFTTAESAGSRRESSRGSKDSDQRRPGPAEKAREHVFAHTPGAVIDLPARPPATVNTSKPHADCAAGSATRRRAPEHPPVIRAKGVGLPPPHMRGAQARLMARRAAEVQAVRNLARKLGLPRGETIRGFRYVAWTNLAKGGVEVIVEYPVRPRGSASDD